MRHIRIEFHRDRSDEMWLEDASMTIFFLKNYCDAHVEPALDDDRYALHATINNPKYTPEYVYEVLKDWVKSVSPVTLV